ncbi:alanine racemase [Pseudochelatococcus sp. G4_1912]|uniref:alanine racemase n=1 Tax=Pseudochelatococcus sp. G4_1912 TaxID=3114288 RepID=UPI0039C71C21
MTSFSEIAGQPMETPSSGLLEIDLGAIRANYRLLQSRLAGARCGGVVKADAYGLGALHVAPALLAEGCRDFFVAHIDEAFALQPVLPPDATLYVLNGITREAVRACAQAAIVPVLNSCDQVNAWREEAQRLARPLPAVLQIDTGMSRLGLTPAEVAELVGDVGAFVGLDVRFIMSHLACADEPSHPANSEQLANFEQTRTLMLKHPALARAGYSFANSAGIFLGADYHFDIVRPGVALYGVNSQPDSKNPMHSVVRLFTRVVQTREIMADAHIGYGYSFTASGPTRVATLAVGYADGWLRSQSGRGSGWCEGYQLPILGRVSMDSMSVDISAVPDGLIHSGTPIELIGPHQTVDDVAIAAHTIGYEILTSLGHRYQRVYKDGSASSDAIKI